MPRSIFLLLALITAAALPAVPAEASPSIQAGDLIRGESLSAVYYYAEDGFRYVFPNEKTYFTWYENFDDVVTLTDAELGSLQIGGNVTYCPGVKMIKITSDPKVYALGMNGTLYWVPNETAAAEYYGADWQSDIDDVPDAFFGNYTATGEEMSMSIAGEVAGYKTLDDPFTISVDKGLAPFTLMDIVDMEYYNPEDGGTAVTIAAGATVMFANVDNVVHTFTAEDGSWGTGTLQPLQNFVRRFDEPGTYAFYCSYHPEMTGTVIVE